MPIGLNGIDSNRIASQEELTKKIYKTLNGKNHPENRKKTRTHPHTHAFFIAKYSQSLCEKLFTRPQPKK